MAAKALQPTLTDDQADAVFVRTPTSGTIPDDVLALLRNLQFQIDALATRVHELENQPS